MGGLATIDRRAATWGLVAVSVAVAVAVLGSGNLRWFDAALVGYRSGPGFPTLRPGRQRSSCRSGFSGSRNNSPS